MAAFRWSGRQLAMIWLVGLIIATGLWILGTVSRPPNSQFFWLLPYEGPLQTTWLLVRSFFVVRPLEATALVGIPTLLFAVTVVWLVRRALAPPTVPRAG